MCSFPHAHQCQRWGDIMIQVMPSSHSTQRAWKLKGQLAGLHLLCSLLMLLMHTENTWLFHSGGRHLNEKEQHLYSNPRSCAAEVNEKSGLWSLQDKSHPRLKTHHQAQQSWNCGQKTTMTLKPITWCWLFCIPSIQMKEFNPQQICSLGLQP